ncbi:hypothetical protein E8E13_008735 [Curvularia kusanoi]|uniref:Rhodopsin domain-containing protein n=1 Tax=Curvularia kusanoi TaxID=90978 RepID=A0A9P4W7H4_CURKU|nr:hypothetical protein E8E13_008735 [Curvularia kusanoi]
MDAFSSAIYEMSQAYPDPKGKRPVANYPVTMYGVTIVFHVIAWVAIGFRLHTRLRVVREPWWDDFFVLMAGVVNLVSVIAFLGGIKYGLGQHLVYILPTLQDMMKHLYVTNAAYHTTTALIKISLLMQYLRLFRQGTLRYITLILLGTVAAWGIAFSFLAWFPCIPVSGFWDRKAGDVCYGFGYRTPDEARATLLVFASTNMFFDITIFLIPLTEFFRPGLRRKQVMAMAGLFTMGSIVVLMAVLRLWSTFKHNGEITKSFDFTWWYPEVLIISCLEIDFAIICASMPIFWPTVVANWNSIFVTKEVHVTHTDRVQDFEMGRPTSLKSTVSQEGLTKLPTADRKYYYFGDDLHDPNMGAKSPALTVDEQQEPPAKSGR